MGQYELVRQVGQGAFGRALLVKNRHEDAKLNVIKEINLRQERLMAGTHLLKKNRERHTPGKQQKRGIMFEIKLSDEETPPQTQMKTEEDEEPEDELLNDTLTFAQGENLRNRPQGTEVRQEVEEEVVKRAEWH